MLRLADVNKRIGFWVDLRMAVLPGMDAPRKGFLWPCGCSGTSDDGEHVAIVPCDDHVDNVAGSLMDGVPEEVRLAAIRALENATNTQGKPGKVRGGGQAL